MTTLLSHCLVRSGFDCALELLARHRGALRGVRVRVVVVWHRRYLEGLEYSGGALLPGSGSLLIDEMVRQKEHRKSRLEFSDDA